MFLDMLMNEPEKLLTIGGWDPCGAFGVATDLKTFAALDCHGMGVMTVVTAQNSMGWYGAEFMSADFVSQQLDAVLGDYGATSVKTGFLGRVDLIETIAAKLIEYEVKNIIVDPVLVNNHGRAMFSQKVVDAYQKHLFPLAAVITPNRREFNLLLTGNTDPWGANLDDSITASGIHIDEALAFIQQCGKENGPPPAFVIKGLPLPKENGLIADGLISHGMIELFPHTQIQTKNVSGTGDSFSAALCCQLAFGLPLSKAVKLASNLTFQAIEQGSGWQLATNAGPIAHSSFRNYSL
ncbi:MAG: hydroxymethylpyrimidine/phosphomethylpyrimidine kinase [Cellvibrionaceae bacterium]